MKNSEAQLVKNLPATQQKREMWVQSLGWEDPLEEEMATRMCARTHTHTHTVRHNTLGKETVSLAFWF